MLIATVFFVAQSMMTAPLDRGQVPAGDQPSPQAKFWFQISYPSALVTRDDRDKCDDVARGVNYLAVFINPADAIKLLVVVYGLA